MPDDQSKFIDREPDSEDLNQGVEGEKPARKGDLPHWADWAPSKTKLWLALGPIIAVPVITTIVNWTARAYLVANHPQILLIMSSNWVNMTISIAKMTVVAFLLVTIVRRMIFVPCYFFLGRWGAERGLEWLTKNSPQSGRIVERLTRWFPRYGPLLVAFYPNRIVFVLAGASTMRFGTFLGLSFMGAALLPILLYLSTFNADIDRTLHAISQFFEDYTWQITAVSFAIAFVIVLVNEYRNPSTGDDLRELEETMEKSIEEDKNK